MKRAAARSRSAANDPAASPRKAASPQMPSIAAVTRTTGAQDHERAEVIRVAEGEADEAARSQQRDLRSARPRRPRRTPEREQRGAKERRGHRDAQAVQNHRAHAPARCCEQVGAGGPAQRGPERRELAREPHAVEAAGAAGTRRLTLAPPRSDTSWRSLPPPSPCPAPRPTREAR